MSRKIVDGTAVISEGNVQFTTPYGQAFINQENRRLFVYLEYVGYLRRNPDAAGFAFWLGKLNQYNGDPFQAEMVSRLSCLWSIPVSDNHDARPIGA